MRHSLPEVRKAIASGEPVDTRDRASRTALFYAVRDGDVDIVAELLQAKADINVQDENGETSLHFAARSFQLDAAKRLLLAGADTSLADTNGNTPLWRATFESGGRTEMVELLLGGGAVGSTKNRSGVSPRDLATSLGYIALVEMLGS